MGILFSLPARYEYITSDGRLTFARQLAGDTGSSDSSARLPNFCFTKSSQLLTSPDRLHLTRFSCPALSSSWIVIRRRTASPST